MNHAKFSVFTHWVSNLGDTRAKSYLGFNLLVVLYSILNLAFVNSLRLYLPNSLLPGVSIAFFYVFSFILILILLFPVDKNYKMHRALADLMFPALMAALVLLFATTATLASFPSQITAVLAITIIAGFAFVVSFVGLRIRHGQIPKTLVAVRKKEKSFFIRNVCLLEWVFLGLLVVFQLFFLSYST